MDLVNGFGEPRRRPRRRWMDLVREDMERVGAKEGDKVDRVKWKYCRPVAAPSREKPKEEEEDCKIYAKLTKIYAKYCLLN